MKKILVAGATGYLGKYVIEAFKRQGYWVRALSRTHGKLDSIKEMVDEEFIGEITNLDSLKGICQDIDIVLSTIGITRQKDKLTYMDVDYQGNINLLEEAKREAVSKFIYISVLNADQLKTLKGVEAKTLFSQQLKDSGLNYSIIYPNGFFADMLEYLQMAQSGRGYVFGTGEYKSNPIHGADLANFCVEVAKSDLLEVDIGGPDQFTHNEILQVAFQVVGKPVKIIQIPLWVRDVVVLLLRKLTPVRVYGPIEFFMTVLAMDMVAPLYGNHHLKDFFEEKAAENE